LGDDLDSSDQLPSPEELNAWFEVDGVSETRDVYDRSSPYEPSGFKRLRVYQLSIELAGLTYLNTQPFPKEELFGLTRQMREAAISVTLNIAEGWGRNGKAEFARFCDIARASAHEVDAGFDIAKHLKYVKPDTLGDFYAKLNAVSRMLLALAAKLRSGQR
jgi:four helix bundle protein